MSYAYARSKTRTKPPDDVIGKRIPENPKFKNIKPVVNTGATAKMQTPQRVKDAHKTQRQDEIFKRIRLSTFVALMIEVSKEQNDKPNISETTIPKMKTKEALENKNFNSVLNGVGELDLKHKVCDKETPVPVNDFNSSSYLPPYLLLDVRENDEYNISHFVTAKNYPSSMLCRTSNYESKELLLYKNVSLSIIVLYDYDESIAMRVATTLTQRGYDNIFILTGVFIIGLKLALSKFKDSLVVRKSNTENANFNQAKCDVQNESLTEDDVLKLQLQLDRIFQSYNSSSVDHSVGCQSRASTALTKQSVRSSKRPTSAFGKLKPWK